MVKIGISVDDHFDVNKVDGLAMIPRQAAYLQEHGYQAYFNAGDTYNDFGKTLTYFEQLQQALGPAVLVRFLAGNHDLVNGISYQEAQSDLSPLYFHEKRLMLPGSETVIIGNNGWYDYSLAPADLHKTPAEFAQWKRAYWIDRAIDQPVSDAVRMRRVLETTQAAIAQAAGHRVVYLTHFVPTREAMVYSPSHQHWQMATALMGSQHLGDLLLGAGVNAVVFGHLHRRDQPLKRGQTTFYHQPVGYGLKRLFEWQSHDGFTEWVNTLVTLEV